MPRSRFNPNRLDCMDFGVVRKRPEESGGDSGSPMRDVINDATAQRRQDDDAVAGTIAHTESLRGQPTSSRHAG